MRSIIKIIGAEVSDLRAFSRNIKPGLAAKLMDRREVRDKKGIWRPPRTAVSELLQQPWMSMVNIKRWTLVRTLFLKVAVRCSVWAASDGSS